jgi:uncharacterized Ntn-hydrolase superfamily protein
VTFSIVARDVDGQSFGVAVASKFLAAGALVPAAQAGVGAVATQSWANLAYRPDGLRLLAQGRSAQETLDALTADDPEREQRQAGIVAATGTGASFTGTGCMAWAGGAVGEGYAMQGNILAGPEVVAAMERAWRSADPATPFARRLWLALTAGDAAGGDRRGRESAAVLVVTPGGGYGGAGDVAVDLRVDDHPDPVTELGRLLDLHRLYFETPDPADCLPLEGALLDEVAARLARLDPGPSSPSPSPSPSLAEVERALAAWAGLENLEERLVPGRLDPEVLAWLRGATGG